MPTFKQYASHITENHGVVQRVLLRSLISSDGDIAAVHTALHQEPIGHSHLEDGTIVNESKTVLTDKSITMTENGWLLDGTPQETLVELNSVITNYKCHLSIKNLLDGKIAGSLRTDYSAVEVEGDTFIDTVGLLLGESYNTIDERN